MLIDIFIYALTFIVLGIFVAKRLLIYLHIFQQEEYDNNRFLRWMGKHKVFDKRLSLGLILACAAYFVVPLLGQLLTVLFVGMTAHFEKDPRRDSKKKLAMTDRAKRIYTIGILFSLVPALALFSILMPLAALVCVQAIPFFMVLANTVLVPYEDSIQKKFLDDAKAKMAGYNGTVIGITGSFGKTSIKHILGHVLRLNAPTLVTPGSVNTPMGITRIVREELNDSHQFFIVEMGAYGPGSIKRLCDLTPPDTAIISTIGHAHYERFKTLDAVAETKYELAQAVIQKNALKNNASPTAEPEKDEDVNEGGKVIVGEKTLSFEYSQNLKDQNKDSFIVVGKGKTCQAIIDSIEQFPEGLEIRFKYDNVTTVVHAPIYGLHQGFNIVLAYVMARGLGIESHRIITALKSCPQIPHRLEVKEGARGGTIIDDAYNSNPVGFRSAMELLNILGEKQKGRRIIITPGMVELGAAHNEIHRQVGIDATQYCDILCVINPKRVDSLIQGFESEKFVEQDVKTFDTFEAAENWLNTEIQPRDVVLIENDLPDLYERIPKM